MSVPSIEGVEYFSGCEVVARALRRFGYVIKAYDIKKEADGSNDINSDKAYDEHRKCA